MLSRNVVLVSAGLCAAASVALGCMIDLPNQLVQDREATLKAPQPNSFAYEAGRLAPPVTDGLKGVEPPHDWSGEYRDRERETEFANALQQGLSTGQVALLERIAATDDGAAALAVEGDLPADVRLYAAAAVDFHHDHAAEAATRFQAILDRPDDQRKLRGVWAAYMLGRIAAAAGDQRKADGFFAQTREMARNGAPDPLGLAVASFGEEARPHYRRAKALLTDKTLPAEAAAEYGREISAAIALYAEQAARGPFLGSESLRIVAEHILADRSTILAAAEIPNAQRLLVAFAQADFYADAPDPDLSDDDAAQAATQRLKDTDVLTILAEAAEQHGDGWLAEGDQLAMLAYKLGQYDLAKRLADKSTGHLASWLKGKLALQAGDLPAATALYADAAKAFPENDASLDPGNRPRLVAESGVLALGRGEYGQAFDLLYASGNHYWLDIAHLAERVLTADELKAFVDAKVAAVPPRAKTEDEDYFDRPLPNRLRDLLARRLVREGRYQEALPYFTDDKTRNDAAAYAQALTDAKQRPLAIGKAQAWFVAATQARYTGMETMGSELAPDVAFINGDFEGSWDAGGAMDQSYVTDGERQRVLASMILPTERFHYRYVAIDQAGRAADLLPPRSQAFAAVLCQASHWMFSTHDDDAAQALYQRYVQQGAVVPWATHFGHSCPAPDFAAAGETEKRLPWLRLRHAIKLSRWWLLGTSLAAGLAVAWIVCRSPKQRNR